MRSIVFRRNSVKSDYRSKENNLENEDTGRIEGRNAVSEALRAGRRIDKLYIASGETDATLRAIIQRARAAGAVISEADRHKLDAMSVTGAHQGVIAVCAAIEYSTIDDIFENAEKRGEKPLIIVCDNITDPHNLGAIIRTAEAAGAHGIIIPKHHSVAVTAVVAKASAGAVEHIAIVRVTNISSTLKELQKRGVWVFGTDASGSTGIWESDLTGATAVVIGSEGEGMSRLVAETCDFKLSIPMFGKVTSLNASVSAALLIYEAVRQRNKMC